MSEDEREQSEPSAAAPLAEVFSDTPLRSAEGLAFEFEGLARTLAELAWNPRNRTPFTVVVRGQWGRGKTTLMRQAQRLFEEGPASKAGEEIAVRKVRSVWFNAWKYPSEETVLAGLLGSVIDEMATGGWEEQLKDLLLKYRGQISGLLLQKVGIKPGETQLSRADEKRAFYDMFRRLFTEILYVWQQGASAALGDLRHKDLEAKLEQTSEQHVLAIFLDDLDRCNRDRVVEVMEAINLFLDLPGVCFYLGLDWQRLIDLLKEKMPGREEAFLEKIVQVSLDLPEVNKEGVHDYMLGLVRGSALESVLSSEGDGDLAIFAEALEQNHPRHVKRVLNDLAMTLSVMRNTGKLGPDDDSQVPEGAVVAWHILHEVSSAEEWREIRSLRANLEAFLERWNAAGEPTEEGAERSELSKGAARLRESGILTAPMALLSDLSRMQKDILVHLGSPPRGAAAERALPRASRLGRLGDLNSRAWVPLAGGEFQMGSDGSGDAPVHAVRLSAYRISRYPVTNGEFAEFVRAVPETPVPEHWEGGVIPEGKENHPVVRVSWNDAAAFCVWRAGRLTGAPADGGTLHLPTEAQWEFACRGAEGRLYPWGSEDPDPDRANFDGTIGDTTPVDRYLQHGGTPEGVLDLAGNVWEWCRDWYGSYPTSEQRDPLGPGREKNRRVLRGGAFGDSARALRGAFRYDFAPELRFSFVGFRVVWSLAGGQD